MMQPVSPNGGDAGITLFLTGDVMTGRGIDQVLPHPSDPGLFEDYVTSALGYVALAEKVNGPLERPVDFPCVWGDALKELDRRRPDARLINLETAVTTSDQAEHKGINYRMHPDNLAVITAAGIDCCVLANNHILDWGEAGLLETLDSLAASGVQSVGAGRDRQQAARPACVPVTAGRVVVFALGAPDSGVPAAWAAGEDRAGVNYLAAMDAGTVQAIGGRVREFTRPGDMVVVSLHWGGNWGYAVPEEQRQFAHRLIDEAGVDIVWGHSSHHPKAIEVYRGHLILYGCGDFLNDYEGIGGHERFRGDLVLMYFPTVRARDGALRRLDLVPLQIRGFRLHRASSRDSRWLCDTLNREGRGYGTRFAIGADGSLTLVGG